MLACLFGAHHWQWQAHLISGWLQMLRISIRTAGQRGGKNARSGVEWMERRSNGCSRATPHLTPAPTVVHALDPAAALQVALHEAEQALLVRAGRHCGDKQRGQVRLGGGGRQPAACHQCSSRSAARLRIWCCLGRPAGFPPPVRPTPTPQHVLPLLRQLRGHRLLEAAQHEGAQHLRAAIEIAVVESGANRVPENSRSRRHLAPGHRVLWQHDSRTLLTALN